MTHQSDAKKFPFICEHTKADIKITFGMIQKRPHTRYQNYAPHMKIGSVAASSHGHCVLKTQLMHQTTGRQYLQHVQALKNV